MQVTQVTRQSRAGRRLLQFVILFGGILLYLVLLTKIERDKAANMAAQAEGFATYMQLRRQQYDARVQSEAMIED